MISTTSDETKGPLWWWFINNYVNTSQLYIIFMEIFISHFRPVETIYDIGILTLSIHMQLSQYYCGRVLIHTPMSPC